jgi:hypothetical protein
VSGFLDPKPLTPAAAAAQAGNPATPLGAALSATYARFVDENGNPLTSRHVVIKVSSTTGEILDIVAEA